MAVEAGEIAIGAAVRPAAAALTAYLAANDSVVVADLYTFALASGEVLRYSGWTTPLTIPGTAFPTGSLNYNTVTYTDFALGPRFGRSKVTTKIGVEPTELDIDVLAGAADLVGTLAFAEAVRVGLFDGATVELDRFFAPGGAVPLDTSLGAIVWFYGRVAESDAGRSKIAIKVKSLMNLLAIQQMPRRLYQASCGHVFGDQMCGYDRAAGRNALGVATGIGAATVTAAAGTTQGLIDCTASVPASYNEGTVTGATGANAGYRRTIANLGSGAQIGLFKPFLYPIAPGDTFTLLPGCDHTTATCSATFQNLARFGGFPYIPPPETAA
jgi:uncharacterized phage protein (TIGR02218 family)